MQVYIGQERVEMSAPYDRIRAISPNARKGDLVYLMLDTRVAEHVRALTEVWRFVQADRAAGTDADTSDIAANTAEYFQNMTVDELADCWMFINSLIPPPEMKTVHELYFDAIYPHKDNPRINRILSSDLLLIPLTTARSDELVNQVTAIEMQLPTNQTHPVHQMRRERLMRRTQLVREARQAREAQETPEEREAREAREARETREAHQALLLQAMLDVQEDPEQYTQAQHERRIDRRNRMVAATIGIVFTAVLTVILVYGRS